MKIKVTKSIAQQKIQEQTRLINNLCQIGILNDFQAEDKKQGVAYFWNNQIGQEIDSEEL